MGFISILMFLIKYGPAILNLIKTAITLIRWLRENDEQAAVQFADSATIEVNLNGMARRCKRRGDNAELQSYVDILLERKASVQVTRDRARQGL